MSGLALGLSRALVSIVKDILLNLRAEGRGREDVRRKMLRAHSGFMIKIHSFRVWFYIFPTRLERGLGYSPLVSSGVLDLPHSFRVEF